MSKNAVQRHLACTDAARRGSPVPSDRNAGAKVTRRAHALAAANRERLTEVADQWLEQYGEVREFVPDDVRKIFYELSGVARSADAEEAGFYLRMC
jgi:hypothetical protein